MKVGPTESAVLAPHAPTPSSILRLWLFRVILSACLSFILVRCSYLLFFTVLSLMFISRFRSSLLRTNLSKYQQLHRINDHAGVNCCHRRFVGPSEALGGHGPLLLSLWCFLSGIALYVRTHIDRNQWRTRVKYTLYKLFKSISVEVDGLVTLIRLPLFPGKQTAPMTQS